VALAFAFVLGTTAGGLSANGVVALFPTLTVTLLNYPVSWVLTSVLFLFYYHFRMKKLTTH